MKVKTFVSMDYFSCNTFVIEMDNHHNFMVDPGYFDEKVKKYIDSIGGISFILITHGHFDHIGCLDKVKEAYPDAKIYAYEEELDVIYNNRKNMAYTCPDRGGSFKKYVPTTEAIGLSEGNVVIDGVSIDVLHTPGHTKGGAIYYIKDSSIVFMGDTIICESIGRSDLPTSSEIDLSISLSKIKNYGIKDDVMCYFGHGYNMDYKTLLQKNLFLRRA